MDTNERSLHNAARRAGLTFPCEIAYLDIPICSGFEDSGTPIVEVKQWPFLRPSDMVSRSIFSNWLFLMNHTPSLWNLCQNLFSCAHASGPGIGE